MTDLFSNAQWLMPSRTDDFFKWVLGTQGGSIQETGNVEAPTGWVGRVEVTRLDVQEYVSDSGDPYISQAGVIDRGWYLIRQNSDGLIWSHFYASQGLAQVDFERVEAAYGDWSNLISPEA